MKPEIAGAQTWHQSQDGRVEWLIPDWPASTTVFAAVTSRAGGHSFPPWQGFNLAHHVGDSATLVSRNRSLLKAQLPAGTRLQWLQQVHGCDVAELSPGGGRPGRKTADAAIVRHVGEAAAVMTADCLPVFFSDASGSVAAVAHAGWRGLRDGVLEHTVKQLGVSPQTVIAWLGPAIGPCHFQVGDEVRRAFLAHPSTAFAPAAFAGAFIEDPAAAGKWMMDIYEVARLRLHVQGVSAVFGGGLCTVCDETHFFSYRRDGITGRMASVICIKSA